MEQLARITNAYWKAPSDGWWAPITVPTTQMGRNVLILVFTTQNPRPATVEIQKWLDVPRINQTAIDWRAVEKDQGLSRFYKEELLKALPTTSS